MTSSNTAPNAVPRRFPGIAIPEPLAKVWTLAVPLVVVWLFSFGASALSQTAAIDLGYALANLIIVVAMWTFIGNSGVLSFGHIAFVAVGAWTLSLLTIPPAIKSSIMPELFPFLRDAQAGPFVALLAAALVGGVLALLSGLAFMRLNGLEAGIATFALLMLVVQILTYWQQIGPKAGQSMTGLPRSFDLQTVLVIALAVIALAWLYGQSRSARMLRASRDSVQAAPASGVRVTLHRLISFTVSGALAAVGGAVWVQLNGVAQASQFSLDFTFTTIAMLVIGGMRSLWGAVVGTLAISALSHVLGLLEQGVQLGGVIVSLPSGSRLITLGAIMVIILIFRPAGITGGREAMWPFRPRIAPPAMSE
ncbi:branched-chain amino acid ABC transporter permease [Leucobacter luti]|uniref:Amino acid/amide ABC transporter membrane protein 2 (HAAT family) n=1 Tax=Leucobacter luti TaxID=340320 RepID=A0A4V6MCY2_9MICO|nr:branched-chain amino acid ABC transporter permease [Leucobacter luti]MBL3698782.1 branched-chain amino acid ABC transporter permease [Leucobacter luti]RZT66159.1 amino acid/amide ABC transporter membrane protein 2 (HAAT family) [Leucobacter luti]